MGLWKSFLIEVSVGVVNWTVVGADVVEMVVSLTVVVSGVVVVIVVRGFVVMTSVRSVVVRRVVSSFLTPDGLGATSEDGSPTLQNGVVQRQAVTPAKEYKAWDQICPKLFLL